MPWYDYKTAIEGLAEEEPWLPRMVELREAVERTPPVAESFGDDFASLGLSVTRMD
jgi:hypothetical protein